jgi:hypothetical protein
MRTNTMSVGTPCSTSPRARPVFQHAREAGFPTRVRGEGHDDESHRVRPRRRSEHRRKADAFDGDANHEARDDDEQEALATERAHADAEARQKLADRAREEVGEDRLEDLDEPRRRMNEEDGGQVPGDDEPDEGPAERLGEQPRDQDADEDGRQNRLIEAGFWKEGQPHRSV